MGLFFKVQPESFRSSQLLSVGDLSNPELQLISIQTNTPSLHLVNTLLRDVVWGDLFFGIIFSCSKNVIVCSLDA